MLDQGQGLLIDQTASFTATKARDQSLKARIDNVAKFGDGEGDYRKAKEAAVDYEATFISQMLEHMFETVPSDGLFGGGQGERVFRSMLNQEYGKAIANRGGIGVADNVMGEIIRIQEQQQ